MPAFLRARLHTLAHRHATYRGRVGPKVALLPRRLCRYATRAHMAKADPKDEGPALPLVLATEPQKKSRAGTATKLTPELQDLVISYLVRGCYIETACGAAGISRQTMYEWTRKGALGVEPYKAFAEAMLQARDLAEASAIDCVTSAARKDWKAAAWYLEKAFGKKYSGIAVAETTITDESSEAARKDKAQKIHDAYGFTETGSTESGGQEEPS